MRTNTQSMLKYLALATVFTTALAIVPAEAQNPNFAPGDLLMGFQLRSGPGSDQTILVNLGNTATVFRDASTVNLLNIANIGALLNSTFGLGAGNALPWYDNPDLYFGLAGVWGSSGVGSTLQNGDPNRTLYVSKSRASIGTQGLANSAPEAVGGNTFMSNGANAIFGVQSVLENNYTTPSAVIPTSASNTWEDENPASGPSQGAAFGGTFAGGIQQSFANGSYGSFSTGPVEGALDLYRFQAVNNISGQYGQGSPVREPEYQGTVVIDQGGNVSFLVTPVPEPSSALLLGATALLGGFLRRRPATQSLR